MNDIGLRTLHRKLERAGFQVTSERLIVHPEIANGKPLRFSVIDYRAALSDLTIQLHEARARRRGDRFVKRWNFGRRIQQLVAGLA